ncbi:MAG TPA: SelT/SelW/SelH family protein [Terriglobia bacterium]|nr:SelT/SelW/SelH family protein [Terriglobia bacterium]
MAQEQLTTFPSEVGELALVPGTGGVCEIRIGGEIIWSRASAGRFPEIRELKQLVRDRIAPEIDLGHSDRGLSSALASAVPQASSSGVRQPRQRLPERIQIEPRNESPNSACRPPHRRPKVTQI